MTNLINQHGYILFRKGQRVITDTVIKLLLF
jgi:hypothetical protein